MRRLFLGALGLALALPSSRLAAQTQDDCPEGSLWEPYSAVCAEVRDVRDQFLPPAEELTNGHSQLEVDDLPVPGGLAVGTTYRELVATYSGRLHTKMFVHPDGLQPDADLPVLYTTATSRVHHGLEVVGIYSGNKPDLGQLGLFAWPCLPDYPCPDGDTSPGWQWFIDLPSLTCNITNDVDQGGHAQLFLYYANHTDKLDDGDPPQWKSAVYLWNYCDTAWDLAWEHTYREHKTDCSVPGSGCGWWGPGIEIFGEDPYPQIGELGYEDSLLYHNGMWSELRWPEAGFRDPETWARTTPWQLFHLDANRGYGAGNRVEQNDAPVIEGQESLVTPEDEAVLISADSLVVNDQDVDPSYHVAFEITLYSGDNYTHSDDLVVPATNYAGSLTVPITVSDGAANSEIFELQIDVLPVNDAPVITGHDSLEVLERSPLTITAEDLNIDDPDDAAENLTIAVQDGTGYQREDNTIMPEAGIIGDLLVSIVASDGKLESESYQLTVLVTPDVESPVLTVNGSATVSLRVGSSYQDAGATAVDNVDGNISDQIVTNNPVNTSSAGTYLVVYSISDVAGNSASATRTVIVQARAKSKGGSGGVDPLLLAFLLVILQRRLIRL